MHSGGGGLNPRASRSLDPQTLATRVYSGRTLLKGTRAAASPSSPPPRKLATQNGAAAMAMQSRTVRCLGCCAQQRGRQRGPPSAAAAAAPPPRLQAHLLLPPNLQAFSLLGALGEVEDVEDVDADVLAPEPVAEEEAPRMPQRPKRVSVALWLASLARPALPPVDAHSVHQLQQYLLIFCLLPLCSMCSQRRRPSHARPPTCPTASPSTTASSLGCAWAWQGRWSSKRVPANCCGCVCPLVAVQLWHSKQPP